jgi:hypothetical protein
VYATQLFAVPSRVALDPPIVEGIAASWYVLRCKLKIGANMEGAAFLRTKLVMSSASDSQGSVDFQVPIFGEPGAYHVGFGKRTPNAREEWIGVYDGVLSVPRNGTPSWTASRDASAGAVLQRLNLRSGDNRALAVTLTGRSRVPAMVLVDGVTHSRLAPDRSFAVRLEFPRSGGARKIEVGVATSPESYLVLHSLTLDTLSGRLHAET